MPDDQHPDKPTKEDRAKQLTKLFYKTPAMLKHAQMLDAVQTGDDSSTETVCIEVSKPLLAMIAFQERAQATEQGRAPAPTDSVLALMVDNMLQEELHWHAVEPFHFEHYRKLWNRFCDEQGAPEHKIAAPGQTAEEGREGPF